MKLMRIQLVCSCGSLIETDSSGPYFDTLDGSVCPGCNMRINAYIINKKDGIAIFLKRLKPLNKDIPLRGRRWIRLT